MKRNIKTVKITIPDEARLNLINRTPALKQWTRSILKVGENVENMNHAQFSHAQRMLGTLTGVKVEDITNQQ